MIGRYLRFMLHELGSYADRQVLNTSIAAEDRSQMQTSIAAFAATVQARPAWLKNTARVAFLLLFTKGAIWVGASWLALRGFGGL